MEKTDYILERTLSNGTERQLTLLGPAAYSEVESGLPGVKSVGEWIRSRSRTALPLVGSGAPSAPLWVQPPFNAASACIPRAIEFCIAMKLPLLLGDVIIDCKTREARQEISLSVGGLYLY
jgi:hypothetical protein